jgi:hypothetical protein
MEALGSAAMSSRIWPAEGEGVLVVVGVHQHDRQMGPSGWAKIEPHFPKVPGDANREVELGFGYGGANQPGVPQCHALLGIG